MKIRRDKKEVKEFDIEDNSDEFTSRLKRSIRNDNR